MLSRFSFPTSILFGAGALAELPAELARAGCRRPLVVADAGLRAAGLLDRVTGTLAAAGVPLHVFEGVEPNPVTTNVEAGAAAYRDGGCDGVVAMGGGSPLDVGKAVRLRVTHSGPLAQYDDVKGGAEKIHGGMPPMVAIPTTAGTGSEVGRSAGIMMAAIMGATAFQKGLGATHSLAHPLSSVAGLHHGLANALLLPTVLRFNLPAVEARMGELARAARL